MIFRINSFNKELDMYEVISDTNQRMTVTSYQIVNVMVQGYIFDNAKLTKKGFAIKTDSGTRFIQVNGMPRELLALINNKLLEEKMMEEQKKQQMTRAINSTSSNVIVDKPINRNVTLPGSNIKVNGSNGRTPVSFRGTLYRSEELLCKQFNRDVKEFKQLRAQGYSVEESLGLKALRPKSELISLSTQNKMLDRMASLRGEY